MKKPRLSINQDTKVLLKQIGIGLGIITVVGLLITSVWYGTRLAGLTITEVTISGGETINLIYIEKIVQSRLDGTYLGIVPKRFTWWYPQDDIVEQVTEIPRVYNVVTTRNGGTTLSVTFDEYTPAGLWCESIDSDSCVFIDDQGYAFAKAPQLSGGSLLRMVSLYKEIAIGETVMDMDSYTSLWTLVTLLAEQSLYVSHIEFDQVGDAFVGLVGGGELKVLITESPARTVENLQTILGSLEFMHLQPGNFQYIDLRFGEKVFIKEEITVPIVETVIEGATSTNNID
jgi:hypothetical protein